MVESMNDQDYRDQCRVIMPTGRHKGKPITRVPVVYLKWMISVGHTLASAARAEIKRRGTVTPDLEVSGHALDRASLKCQHRWRQDRRDGEGLHAWLIRVSGEALRTCRPTGDALCYKGLKLVFAFDCEWPVLKTVMLDKRKSARVRITNERSN
jgi:hypothetical protein